MSDTGDRNDGDSSGDEESLAPRSRKRRGLRVPVDDVPRQSFVDLPQGGGARESGVGRPLPARVSQPRLAQEMRTVEPASSEHAWRASTPPLGGLPATAASRPDVPSVEVSLDAELEVEAAPVPPAPRSYRPPPPPPSWSPPPAARPSPAATNESSLDDLARAVTVAHDGSATTSSVEPAASDLGLEASFEVGTDDGGDELAAEPTRVSVSRERPGELDWTGESTPTPIPHETTKVGKKRSSAPPDLDETAAASSLPDAPLEAPLVSRESVAALPNDEDLGEKASTSPGETESVAEISPVPSASARASRPPLADPREAPRGLFGGTGSTEIAVPEEDAPPPPRKRAQDATPQAGEDFADTVFAPVEEVPRARRVTTAMPRRVAPGSDPPLSQSMEDEAVADIEGRVTSPTPAPTEMPETPAASAPLEDLSSPAIEIEPTSIGALEPPASGETLVGLGAPTKSSPDVVTISPVVVVSRAVNVIGSPAAPPPEPRVALTTPGGLSAPSPTPELSERESDPSLPLDLDPDSGALDELVEMPSQPAPPKAAPPPAPPKGAPPAPPKPPAPAPSPQITAAEPAQLPSRPPPKKKHQWWEDLFSDDYLRTVPVPSAKSIHKQVDFIETRLGLAKGAAILDVGCGLGLHAIELTRRGYVVVGLDLSLPMLSRAADEAQDQGFKINFLHADMREMNFEGAFDAVLVWGTTLGYFDDDSNKAVLDRFHRALKPGGLLLLETVNRDFVIRSQPNLVWFQGDGCVVMEESSFNYIASRLAVKRNVILDDGRQRESMYSIRLYSLHELGQILHLRGFRVVEITGREAMPGVFFGADSPKLIILAERRVMAPPAPPGKSPEGPKTGESTKAIEGPKSEPSGGGEPPPN